MIEERVRAGLARARAAGTGLRGDREETAGQEVPSDRRHVADLPIDRIAKAVRPTEAQQPSLDELKAASMTAAIASQVR
jgi:hypothetical protein